MVGLRPPCLPNFLYFCKSLITLVKTFGNDPQETIILNKARAWCAAQERCEWELRTKLKLWGASSPFVTTCLAQLRTENYVNEERFARMFAGGKFRMLKWGRVKIEAELRKRKISQAAIGKGLAEIDEQTYLKTLQTLISRKRTELKHEEPLVQIQKLARFAISKGYESAVVFKVIGYESE